MKRQFLLIILISFMFSGMFAAELKEKPKLAIMEFEDRSETLDQTMLSNAAEYLRSEFVGSDQFVIIAKERQEKMLISEMKKESYKMCRDRNCQIPLGQALSADSILRTTINYFGGIYNITTELIDLAKEATVKGAKYEFDGTEQQLKDAIDKIFVQIKEISVIAEKKTQENEMETAIIAKKEENREIKWSKKSDNKLSWSESKKYCEKLKEDGFSDWRLPTISELRTIVQKCAYTEAGGKCNVTDDCTDKNDCRSSYCDGCPYRIDGGYSKFGYSERVWSVSELSDGSVNSWLIDFSYGNIQYGYRIKKYYAICVR